MVLEAFHHLRFSSNLQVRYREVRLLVQHCFKSLRALFNVNHPPRLPSLPCTLS